MTEPVAKAALPGDGRGGHRARGFLIGLTILSFQMRSGEDPALRSARNAAAAAPRTIVKRRIIETRVIITDAPPARCDDPRPPPQSARRLLPSVTSAPRVAAPPVQIVQAPPVPVPAPVTRTS